MIARRYNPINPHKAKTLRPENFDISPSTSESQSSTNSPTLKKIDISISTSEPQSSTNSPTLKNFNRRKKTHTSLKISDSIHRRIENLRKKFNLLSADFLDLVEKKSWLLNYDKYGKELSVNLDKKLEGSFHKHLCHLEKKKITLAEKKDYINDLKREFVSVQKAYIYFCEYLKELIPKQLLRFKNECDDLLNKYAQLAKEPWVLENNEDYEKLDHFDSCYTQLEIFNTQLEQETAKYQDTPEEELSEIFRKLQDELSLQLDIYANFFVTNKTNLYLTSSSSYSFSSDFDYIDPEFAKELEELAAKKAAVGGTALGYSRTIYDNCELPSVSAVNELIEQGKKEEITVKSTELLDEIEQIKIEKITEAEPKKEMSELEHTTENVFNFFSQPKSKTEPEVNTKPNNMLWRYTR